MNATGQTIMDFPTTQYASTGQCFIWKIKDCSNVSFMCSTYGTWAPTVGCWNGTEFKTCTGTSVTKGNWSGVQLDTSYDYAIAYPSGYLGSNTSYIYWTR